MTYYEGTSPLPVRLMMKDISKCHGRKEENPPLCLEIKKKNIIIIKVFDIKDVLNIFGLFQFGGIFPAKSANSAPLSKRITQTAVRVN